MAVFGFFFAAQSLLWGMGLASLPIIIHLLNRRRFKIVDWAAMHWLLEAIKKNRRRVRLEQWLLLAIRTLLIALVVAAMAKPLLEGAAVAQAAVATSATHHILVFDNSLSMQFVAINQSRWEKAKGVAHAILDDARKGDLASLVAIGAPSVAIVGDASPDLAAVGREVDSLRPQHGAGRFDEALAHVERILGASRAAAKQVYFIGDLQKNAWLGRDVAGDPKDDKLAGAEARLELGNRLKRISARAGCTVVDMAETDAGNVAVAAVESAKPLVVRNRPAGIRARVVNYSKQPHRDLRVQLVVDGQVEKSEAVNLEPGEEATVNYAHQFAEAGDKVVEVRIPADGLKPDDARQTIVAVRENLRVLLVDGKPSGEPFKSETDYLRYALSPDTDEGAGLIRTEVKSEPELTESKLEDYDVVAICNVAQLTPTEATVLDDYLKRGGAIVFFLGSQVDVEAYNRQLFADGAGILPARLLGVQGDASHKDKPFSFDPLGYRHPIVEAFRGAEQAGLITARIHQYMKLELPAGGPAAAALAFSSKDPAIVTAPCRRGTVAVVATGCGLDWNSWALSPSYVPVVQELIGFLSERGGKHGTLTVGEPIVVPIVAKGADGAGRVATPDAQAGAQPIVQEKNADFMSFARTDLAGAYRVDVDAPAAETWRFSVNPPIEESDLTKLAAADLRSTFPGFNFTMLDRWQGRSAAAALGAQGTGELHRPLLYLALLFAFFETLLAWRFSHHR